MRAIQPSRAAVRGPTAAAARRAHPARSPAARCVLARESKGKSVDDVLAAANALLENLSAGNSPPSLQQSIDELQEMGYVCDESGCVLVLPGDREATGPPAIRRMLTGNNWSLGTLPEDNLASDEGEEESPYSALVAGPCWSVPLKPGELSDFVGMLSQLRSMVYNLRDQGQWAGATADRPDSRVKWETNHIVMQASFATAAPGFNIEMTFRTDRRSVTTHWPAEVAAAVLAAVDAELGNGSAAAGGGSSSSSVQRSAAAATVSA